MPKSSALAPVVSAAALSGAASLILESVWIRTLGLSLGSSTQSLALVTAILFGGLAIGAALGARMLGRSGQALRRYAMLEMGIALWAYPSLALLEGAHVVYALPWLDGLGLSLAKAGISIAVMLPPAVAMGATFPLLVHGAQREDRRAQTTALLYAVNTAGAVVGCLLAGLLLIPGWGVGGAVLCALAADAVAAALILTQKTSPHAAPSRPRRPSRSAHLTPLPMLVAGVGGVAGMGAELIFFRALHVSLVGTLETTTVVLAAFLSGIVAGSAAYKRVTKEARPDARAVLTLLLVSAMTNLLASTLLEPLALATQGLADHVGPWATVARFASALSVLLPVAALNGALFPAAVDLCGEQREACVGRLLAVNTAGGVAGSLLVGTLLLPGVGSSASLYLITLMSLSVVILYALSDSRRLLLASAILALLIASLLWPGIDLPRIALMRAVEPRSPVGIEAQLDHKIAHTVYAAEGAHGVVSVVEAPPGRWTLYIDGLVQSVRSRTSPPFSLESVLLGAFPAALAREHKRALVIGMGTGITAEALLAAGLAQVDVVELEPRVVEALGVIKDGRRRVDTDPRVRVIIDDGRALLQRLRYRATTRYDVITSQPSHWWLRGVGNLATREFFELVDAALDDGGVYFQWLNGHRMTDEVVRGLMGSMRAVFDEVWIVAAREPNLFYLAGFKRPAPISPEQVTRRLAHPRLQGLAPEMPRDTVDLLSYVSFSGEPPKDAPDVPNRDRDALIETRLARSPDRHMIDFSAMRPPPLDQAGPPRQSLAMSDQAFADILLESAERRLGTPGGLPKNLLPDPPSTRAFGAVSPAMARVAVRAARPWLPASTMRYLDARLAILEERRDSARQALLSLASQTSTHARRAWIFAALISREAPSCTIALHKLPAPAPEDALGLELWGELQLCAGNDPGAAFLRSLQLWNLSFEPTVALRWQGEQAAAQSP